MSKSLKNIGLVSNHFGANSSGDNGVNTGMSYPSAALIEFSSNSTNITIQNEQGELRSITHKPGLGALNDQGCLDFEIVEGTLSFLEDHRADFAAIPADNIRSYGTGSLRDAKDSDVFQGQVEDKFGLKVNVLSGADEAHNSAIGIKSFFGDQAQGIVWDFGGRSSEFAIIGNNGQITDEVSLQLGSLVLSEIKDGQEMLDYIRSELEKLPEVYESQYFDNMYVTGGNPRRVVGQVVGEADYKKAHGRSASAQNTVNHISSLLEGDAFLDEVDDSHFHELFPKAGLVFQELLHRVNVEKLVASNSATRAGAVAQLNEDIQARGAKPEVSSTIECE